MKELDKGHEYNLTVLDGSGKEHLQFVKRIGKGYPYNEGLPKSGTTNQEVLRVLISRTQYLNLQKPHWINPLCILFYRICIYLLELRASKRKGNTLSLYKLYRIEVRQTCKKCGHINCKHE
jgi:hypothetical protein